MVDVFRDDLRLDRHPCRYRKVPHQIQGGCGCFCDLCAITEDDNVTVEGEAPPDSEN